MLLYVTWTSPYARLARIMVLEKDLADRIEVIEARTRTPDSPYYAINPSGRVPYLVRDDGSGLEDSPLICRWLDHLDGSPVFDHPDGDDGWESRRLVALARSLMESVSVRVRMRVLPESERAASTDAHEGARAQRLLAQFETEAGHRLLTGPFNMPQISLAIALDLDHRLADFQWRDDFPALRAWAASHDERPSLAATRPSGPPL